MTDVLEALVRTRLAFRMAGLKAPIAIYLSSNGDGQRLLAEIALTQHTFLIDSVATPVEYPDGSAWMELEIYAIKICWPAVKYTTADGGHAWQ